MKRIKRLMSVLLVCCMLAPVTANAAAIPLEGNDAQSSFTQSELEGISSSLKVPESLDAELTQSEPYYWEAGERWLVQITITYQGETVAGAAVDATTGELIRNILTYSGPSAEEEIVSWNGHRYQFIHEEMTWQDAQAYCEDIGGHLVTITSQAEQDFVYTSLVEKYGVAMIGLNDAASEGTWEWVTGEPFSYANWDGGEPNNQGNEDYVFINANGSWNDGHANREYNSFICEWEPEAAEDAKFRFYLDTASNCMASGSSAEMYAGLFANDTLYPDSSASSYDISVSDSSVVRITADGWSDTLGQHYRLEALQPGSVTVTITDPRAGASGTLELHVVDSEMVYTFDSVPEMTIEDGKTTNFYDFSGLVIDGFRYTERADGDYDVNMTIYNTLDLYAAVTAYDKDGNVYDYAVADKFKSMDSSFVDSVCSLIKQTGDLFYLLDNERYYSGESISKKTDISIEVPKGGYLEISNNAQSVVPLIANATGIMVDFISAYGELALDIGKTLDSKWIAEQVLEDALSKDYLKSAMVNAIQDAAKNELMNGNWSATSFRDGMQSFFDALTRFGFDLMETITRKIASAAGVASLTESAVMNIIPTGHLIDLLYSGSDAAELVIEAMAFYKSFERPAGIYIQPEGFTDISADAYYYDAVQWAVDQEITTGTSDLTFGPDDTCTRAQAVTFLWRAAGAPAPSDDRNPFRDVGADAYYHDAVLWAVENGITSGTGDAVFSPDESCSRAQIVTFLYRQAGSPSVSGGSFSDVQPDSYYAPAVRWAVAQDITSGTSGTTFSPESDCTRAQIVTFLYRDAEM